METCATRVRIITKAIRLFALAATCLLAHGAWAADAIWIGGESGDMNTAANWSSAITDSGTTMMFTNDCTVSLSDDLTAYSVFSASTDSSGDAANRFGKNVTINLNGHTLKSNGAGSSNRHFWHARNSTLTFTGGIFENVQDGGTTNSIVADNQSHYGMSLVVTGSSTKFVSSFESRVKSGTYPETRFKVLDGAEAVGPHFYFGGYNSTNEISGGASLKFDDTINCGVCPNSGPGFNNLLTVNGATLSALDPSSKGTLYVGNGSVAYDNLILAENGATIDVFALSIGINAATNNEMRVTGSGTKFTQVATTTAATSYIGNGASSVSNRLVVADRAIAEFNRVLCIGTGGSVGGTLRIENGGVVTNKSIVYIGHNNSVTNGRSARVVVTGEGSEWTSTGWQYLINSTGDAANAHEIFVGDGAKFKGKLGFSGVGNRLVVSNATVTLDNLMTTNTAESCTGASGSTIRIAGADAKLTTSSLNGGDKGFAGSEVIEFVIPETGWAEAPFRANVAFTIHTGVKLTLDADSVKAYVKANPNGGKVPLMYTGGANRAITIEDATALAANLPSNCELVNASGVLSCRIKAPGLTIIFK